MSHPLSNCQKMCVEAVFVVGAFNERPSLQRFTTTLYVNLVFKFLQQADPNEVLSMDLTLRTVTLLDITTCQRIQTRQALSIGVECLQLSDRKCLPYMRSVLKQS